MFRVALAQVDVVLGDPDANLGNIAKVVSEAARQGAELVVFPELATHGYDLGAVAGDRSLAAGDPRLAALSVSNPDVVVGFHESAGVRTHNAVAYLSGGAVVHVQRKLYLPTYLAWEERKHTSPGQSLRAFDTRYGRAAVLVCNDAWQAPLPWIAAQDGAEILFVPANSAEDLAPGSVDPEAYWDQLLGWMARMQQCWVLFVNRVGTETGANFWGGSRVLDPSGRVVARAPRAQPSLLFADIEPAASRRQRRALPLLAEARLDLVGREMARLAAEGGDR